VLYLNDIALYSIRSGIFEPVEFFEIRSDVVVFWGFSDSRGESILNSLEAIYLSACLSMFRKRELQ